MKTLTFNITFHGPFAVATGVADAGLDNTVDPTNPLPSTALKGLLKAQLRDGLSASPDAVDRIFNGERSSWVFADAEVDIQKGLWTRVEVDEQGRAAERSFVLGEQAFARNGKYDVIWEGPGAPSADEVRALRAAARMVTSLGSQRRRGLGWVTITDEEPWTATDTAALQRWLRGDVEHA